MYIVTDTCDTGEYEREGRVRERERERERERLEREREGYSNHREALTLDPHTTCMFIYIHECEPNSKQLGIVYIHRLIKNSLAFTTPY